MIDISIFAEVLFGVLSDPTITHINIINVVKVSAHVRVNVIHITFLRVIAGGGVQVLAIILLSIG